MEKACKQKKEKEGAGGGGSGQNREASSFHGGFSVTMAELTYGDSHHSVEVLQEAPAATSMGKALATSLTSTPATTFLADSGASHHTCHDRSYFCKIASLSGPFKVN